MTTKNRYTYSDGMDTNEQRWMQGTYIEQLKQKHITCLADYTDILGPDKPLINKLRGHGRPYTTVIQTSTSRYHESNALRLRTS